MKIVLGFFLITLLHELGHLLAARLMRVPVQNVVIFFNPFFTLFSFKTRRTEYSIGWLPIGGYTSFRRESVPAFQRIVIYAAGPVINIIIGFSILGFSGFTMAVDYLGAVFTLSFLSLNAHSFIELCAFFSILMGIVNLIPYGSFDGFKILKEIRKMRNLRYIHKQYKKHEAGRRK